jgi:GNAT superfamily N-acetyltransferase
MLPFLVAAWPRDRRSTPETKPMKILDSEAAAVPAGDYAPKADPDVVAAWVEGWTLTRGVSAPVAAHGGLHVDVGLPGQKARYVFAEASPGVGIVSREVTDPEIIIKVCALPEAVAPLLAEGWVLQPLGFLMIADELTRAGPGVPDGYRPGLEAANGGYFATLHAGNGDLGASGRVSRVGPIAVFDQIVTHPDHRRRGLGRAVMSALGAAVARDGATRGVLVATPDGRALYGPMGWRLHAPVSTAARPT